MFPCRSYTQVWAFHTYCTNSSCGDTRFSIGLSKGIQAAVCRLYDLLGDRGHIFDRRMEVIRSKMP